ncbi:putative ATP-dependent RNA helicase TDRD12 [Polyodon spathula]|uniref:putative ATP-dependent RNA helicase TDRD12 n=1 Tax=Polyodon spathula TaxID=7913 RepID=UPI001B7EBB37|nr:putative ATP-dependent RNA helicase TDRD12 [Polyodon spathula]
MLKISILKIEDPGCFWGRILKGFGVLSESPEEYQKLHDQMNLFYHEVHQDIDKIKPASLEQGQICIVYSIELKSWCRAFVESLFLSTDGYHAMCFLVDKAERVVVKADDVRAPVEKFMSLPYWAKKFRLSGVQPVTLLVDICNEKAGLIPATRWDSAAIQYFINIVQGSTLTEAMLRIIEGDSFGVELYLTINNEKICVNDDLVIKKFACYLSSTEKNKASTQQSEDDDNFEPEMSPCQLSLPTMDLHKESRSPAEILWPGFMQGSTLKQVSVRREHVNPVVVKQDKDPAVPEIPVQVEMCPVIERKTIKSDPQDEYRRTIENLTEKSKIMDLSSPNCNLRSELVVKELDTQNGYKENMENITEDADQIDLKRSASKNLESDETALREECTCDRNINASKDIDEELAKARLLQFLNPDPLNSGSEPLMHTQGILESRSGVFLHSVTRISPCTSLDTAPITDNLKKALIRHKYQGPNLPEAYCWPAIARGCDTVLISHSGKDPLSYIPPFLTFLQLSSVYSSLLSRTGPIAVVLCPGWQKAQYVFDTLEEYKLFQPLNPMLILVGLGKEEAKNVKILKGCQIIVTTPKSLVRLLAHHCFLFLRLCHLVFDEVDVLFSRASEQMSAILEHFKKAATSEERVSLPQQIIAVGDRWNKQIRDLVKEYMSDPCVVITIMEEAALYGNVHQVILVCLDCEKISVLLSALDFTPDIFQKTLIFTDSAKEADHVFKAVSNTSAFCLKVHEGLTYRFDFVMEQWRKEIGFGTHIILVLTNDCMKALGITDATCIVHFSFPSTPKMFGSRLCSMSENFRNLVEQNTLEQEFSNAKSVLLLSEKNAGHVTGVLRYFEHADVKLPPELTHFAEGVLMAKEEQKSGRPLCKYLKCFGFCSTPAPTRERQVPDQSTGIAGACDSRICSDRHFVRPEQETQPHPSCGTISVLPLYVVNASCYFGRIVSKKEDLYSSLAADMAEYYACNLQGVKEITKGGLYGIKEGTVYHRVQALDIPEKGDCLFYSISVRFIDEGRAGEVREHQLLCLPSEFQSLPPQAVEFIVCRVKPIDNEIEWNPKVSRHINQKIKGVQHEAKIVLRLGNTIWVDPMIRVTKLANLRTYINEYNIRSEIIGTGMGTDNPEHVALLRQLCLREGLGQVVETQQEINLESSTASSVQNTVNSSDELAAVSSDDCNSTPSEGKDSNQQESLSVSYLSSDHEDVSLGNCVPALANPFPVKITGDLKPTSKIREAVLHKNRLHPEVQWFQKEDSVIINIKIQNPHAHECEFFSDRVTFSALVDDKLYCADLELHDRILEDKSTCAIKCNEPVITLIKEKKGVWQRLLQHKNTCVTLDFDHFDDLEEEEEVMFCNGGDTTAKYASSLPDEEGCYVYSDGESDSD